VGGTHVSTKRWPNDDMGRNTARGTKKGVLTISKVIKRRTGEATEEINKIITKLVTKAEDAVEEAKKVVKNASSKTWRDGRKACKETKRLVNRLKEQIKITERIIEQSKKFVYGNRIIPDRIVSIFDSEARPIKKGKLKAPTDSVIKP